MADTDPVSAEKRGFGTMFGQKPLMEADTSMQQDVTMLTTRLRVAEERYSDLRRKLQLIEQNMLGHQKKALMDAKNAQTDLMEMKKTLRVVEDRVVMAIKELQLTARKEDVDVLKRYIEMWDPIRFVSHDQVDKLIDEKLGVHKEEMHEE